MDALEYTPFSSPDAGILAFDSVLDAALDAEMEASWRRRTRRPGRHRYGIADQLEEIGRMSRRAEYAAELAGDALAYMEATR